MPIFEKSVIAARRQRLEEKLNSVLDDGDLVSISCGLPLQKPGGLDQTYDFLPHPEYFWLTGNRRSGGVTVYCKETGWVDFVIPVTSLEKLWEGSGEELEGQDVSGLSSWINKNQFRRHFALGQASTELKALERPLSIEEKATVQEAFNQVRRIKDKSEIELIQKTATMAAQGYSLLKKIIRPGITERQIQIEYEAEVLRAGAEKFPYGTIVGAGSNSAVLHAVPTNRQVRQGDLVLIDAGADWNDYCVDITRVFSADDNFNSRQKQIYDLVLQAQLQAIEKCQPGVDWKTVHQTAARVIAEGLKSLNLMRGETDSLLESGAISVFFPHGVGHMVGLKVRDVGGKFHQPPGQTCGIRLRVDLNLEENFIMTVEPGVYFVQALLGDSETRRKFQDQINWAEAEKWSDFGGVRIEDDILITAKGPQNITQLVAK